MVVLYVSLWPVFATGALASAWNAPAGQGIVITDVTFSGGSRYFNGLGHLAPARPYTKHEFATYIEYGVTDWLMAVVRPSLTSVKVGAPDPGRYTGLGATEAGAQVHLLTFGPAVFAIQSTFRLPPTTKDDNFALVGNTSRDFNVRALAGTGFALGSWAAFAELQAGYGLRSSGAPAEWHADLTLGARPVPRLLLLLQNFNTIPQGPGAPWFPRSQYSKLSFAAVYDLTPSWSVEIGAFTTIGGRDALREQGFKTGLWYRF